MRFVHAFLLASLFIFARPVHATEEQPSIDEIVHGVESAYQNVHSMRADFVQITRSAALGEETKERGKVHFKKPKMMRWEFGGTQAKAFVTDGKKMWVYTAADKQVIISEELGQGAGMSQLLDDMNNLSTYFDVSYASEPMDSQKKGYVLDLKPKEQTSFKALRVTVAKKKYTLERVVVVDAFDNEVDLSFSQVRLNPELADSMFVFEVPAGVNVIEGL